MSAWSRLRSTSLAIALLAATAACGGPAAGQPTGAATTATPSAAATTTLAGRVLHVAPRGGDGGAGTAEDPFGSLAGAFAQLQAGDTLMVADGTYEERVEVEVEAGREDAPVRVVAAPGARPVLRGLLWLEDPTWWRLEGLNVTWDDDNESDEHMVKLTGGTDWVFSDAEVWGARSFAAILVAGEPERFALRRLHVHDTVKTNGTNEDHLIYLNSGRGGGVVEQSLLVGSPNGRAIKVGPAKEDGPAVANLVLRYNTMVDNLGPSNVQFAWGSKDNLVYRNIMVGTAPRRANVTSFDLSGRDNVVRDNIGWRSDGVVEPETKGLRDGGGNLLLDPRLEEVGGRPYVPTAPRALAYGYAAAEARAAESPSPSG